MLVSVSWPQSNCEYFCDFVRAADNRVLILVPTSMSFYPFSHFSSDIIAWVFDLKNFLTFLEVKKSTLGDFFLMY